MSLYDSASLIINILLVVTLLVVLIWLFRQERIKRLDKRLGKYAVESINDNRESLFDMIVGVYQRLQSKINRTLYKSKFLKNYANKYQKYIDKSKRQQIDPMDYVFTKLICAILILGLVFVNNILNHNIMLFYQLIIGFLVGFYIPDLFLFGKRKLIKHQIENDLLKAITIMNNSFKSGRSIFQTIKIVCDEIEGPLKEEFKKMYRDLSYGLDIETVFERFNERVKLNEVQYITTSLSILNKTGGNIVKVFSSIERTMFNNRKLNEELKNLSASAKFLYHVLTIVPVLFVIVIYMLDPSYFMPLFKSLLGIIIIIGIIIIYITYIIVVKKIIRIKEY